MKIVLTGGGTGGHFYPLIAVAEQLIALQRERRVLNMEMFFLSTTPYDQAELDRNGITFKRVIAGKRRAYFSPLNILDMFRTVFGAIRALFTMFSIYPDAVFSKGGFSSFPVVFAARILRIPVFVHESDTVPGRVNRWAGKRAAFVGVAFKEAVQYFPEGVTEVVGRPILSEVQEVSEVGAREYLHIHEDDTPILLVLGGSQGAERLNEFIVEILPDLVKNYIVIHQTGEEHIEAVERAARAILHDSEHKDRYKPFGYINSQGMRMAGSISTLVISRAGSTLFEIAAWGKPSILIPLPGSHAEHQYYNARAYEAVGACRVIQQPNLTRSVFLSTLDSILKDEEALSAMSESATRFHNPDSAAVIAKKIFEVSLSHHA